MARLFSASFVVWEVCGVSPAIAQVKLEFKHVPGAAASLVEQISSTQTLKIAGQNVESKSDSKIGIRVEQLPAADNLLPVKMTTESIVLNAVAAGQNIVFDSANPNAKSDNPALEPVLDALRAVLATSVTYQIGADGKVSRIEGVQAILSKAPAAAAKYLEPQFKEQRLKDAFEQQRQVLTDTPVNVGDTWKRTEDWHIDGGQTLSFDRTYEYAGIVEKDGRQLDKIKVKDDAVRYQLGQNEFNLALKESDLKIDSSEGSLLFDRQEGAIVERNSTAKISGKLTLLLNGQELPAELDLKVTRALERKK